MRCAMRYCPAAACGGPLVVDAAHDDEEEGEEEAADAWEGWVVLAAVATAVEAGFCGGAVVLLPPDRDSSASYIRICSSIFVSQE